MFEKLCRNVSMRRPAYSGYCFRNRSKHVPTVFLFIGVNPALMMCADRTPGIAIRRVVARLRLLAMRTHVKIFVVDIARLHSANFKRAQSGIVPDDGRLPGARVDVVHDELKFL